MTTEVKYTGTIFQGWGVRAILEGRKTQTRRVIKPQPTISEFNFGLDFDWNGHILNQGDLQMYCPYGQVGDRLWVRETHYRFGRWVRNGFTKSGKQAWRFVAGNSEVRYMDSPPDKVLPNSRRMERGWFKRVSIHMPRSASRITLEITGVKVERIHDISREDIKAEGIEPTYTHIKPRRPDRYGSLTPSVDHLEYLSPFVELWDSINAKRDYGWDVNPWDWALTFKVVNGKS